MHIVLVGAELEENLAIRSLAAVLLKAGHKVGIVRFDVPTDIEPAARAIVDCGAKLVGLSMVFTHRAREFAALAKRIRALGFSGHITAGGHFASFHAVDLLATTSALDSVVIGEGEPVLLDLVDQLSRPKPCLELVRGLVLRGRLGIEHTPAAEKPLDLDTLPPPLHRRPFHTYMGLPIANLLASRGCEHACSFCSIAAWHRLCGGPRYRTRGIEAIADEMASLYAQGVRIFNFHDDHFLLRHESETIDRVEALARALQARGVGRIGTAIKARPDRLTDGVLDALAKIGLFRVFVGIEAGTETSLRQLGRGQTLEDNERALALLEKHAIHAAFNVLLFNPDSTLDDIVGNIRFLERHADFPSNFCRTEVYAGTPLEARLRKAGRLRGDFWGWDYAIEDPEAQALFEVARGAFEQRNFALDGLHHANMRLDYERQLREHFWGPSPSLHDDVKEVIRAINLDSAKHLSWAVDQIKAKGTTAVATLAAELGKLVAESDALLAPRATAQLEAIHASAQRATAMRKSTLGVAASVAATLAMVVVPACTRTETSEMAPHWPDAGGGAGGVEGGAMGGTFHSEMAPKPVDGGGGTYYSEMAPNPVDASADTGANDGGRDAGTGGTFHSEMVPGPMHGTGGKTYSTEMAPAPLNRNKPGGRM